MTISKFYAGLLSVIFVWVASAIAQSDFASADCSGQMPAGYTRIYIAERHDSKAGTGTASDPFDGSTAQKFDAVLRGKTDAGVTNLIVCIGPGTYLTNGNGDYVMEQEKHLDRSNPTGFTLRDHWRIHGASMERTTLRLADLFRDPSKGKVLDGLILGTASFRATEIEVSDLTLDDNYPNLKSRYHEPLQLGAVMLRSNKGHEWIHNIHVMNPAGERAEDFPVGVTAQTSSPENQGNIIENVTMDHWAGGTCTAIVIAGGGGEIRKNKVTGYQIGYGGWLMTGVNFHDNVAIDTEFGFNIDSWENKQITIAHNEIVHPKYGMVVGGHGKFHDISIHDNTITLGPSTANALVFQGNVQKVNFVRNKIVSQGGSRAMALMEKGTDNSGNTFEENVIPDSLNSSLQGGHCAYKNVNESGRETRSVKNTQNQTCGGAQ